MQTQLELYQRVAPLAGLGIWERNLNTGEAYWNTIIAEILEIDSAIRPGLEETLSLYRDVAEVRELINCAISTRVPQSGELEIITAKGNFKWVKVYIQACFEEEACTHIYGTMQDITEEIKLREQSKELEQRFSKAFAHAPIGMALVSLQGEWIKVNHSIKELFGYTEEELMQLTFQEITHPEDLEADIGKMDQLLQKQSNSYSMEKRYFHKNGHVIWAQLSVSLVRDDQDVPLYYISQIKDITERRMHMETINGQNSRLLNFAYIVSHNLRSHAGNIQMLTTMVLEEQEESERKSLIELLAANADNLQQTLTNLNEIVKIHNDGLSNIKLLNLYDQVIRTLEILSAAIIKESAQVLVNIDRDTTLMFNPAYLESILINLISNSLRYRKLTVAPIISISAVQAHGKIIFKIEDNGLGIDLKLQGHKLFGMYKTFHGNDDARGMGLFLVKNQVEAMGGKITAESELNEGLTFTIELNKN